MNSKLNNRKGVKLLAAMAILAMVACAFVVTIPGEDADAATTPAGAVETDLTTSLASGVYKLKSNIDLSADLTIPAGVTLYTDGKNLDAKTYTVTVNGTLIVNNGSTLTIASKEKASSNSTGTITIDSSSKYVIGAATVVGKEATIVELTSGTAVLSKNTVGDQSNPQYGYKIELKGANAKIAGTVGVPDLLVVDSTSTISTKDNVTVQGAIKVDGTFNVTGTDTLTVTESEKILYTSAGKFNVAYTAGFNIGETPVIGNNGIEISAGSIQMTVNVTSGPSYGYALKLVGTGEATTTGLTIPVADAIIIDKDSSLKDTGTLTVNGKIVVETRADNANALGAVSYSTLAGSGSIQGSKWIYSISKTELTLNGYDGKERFDGAFTKVVLTGTNVIDLTKVKGIMGDEVFAAIKTSAETLSISGDTLQIKIAIEKGVTSSTTKNGSKIAGIYADNSGASVTITNKNLKIAISGDMIMQNDETNQGIYGVYSAKDLVVGTYTVDGNGVVTNNTPVAVDVSVSPSSAYAFGFTGITKAKFTMTGSVEAGNRALFVSTNKTSADESQDMILKGCGTASTPLLLIASEKAIQAKSSDMSVTASNIDASISGNELYNHGNDDVWGILAGKLTVDATSKITTQGLRVNGSGSTISNAGIIIVSGDYQQNPMAVTKTSGSQPVVTIAGFYYDSTTKYTGDVTEKSAAAGKIYLTNGAQYYGAITVDSKTTDKATDQNGVSTAFESGKTTVTMTAGEVSALTIPANKTLQIGNAVTFAAGSIITINEGSEVQISNPTVAKSFTIKNAGVGGSQAVFENVIGTFTITYGSIVIDSVEITAGSVTLRDGDVVKISGSIDDDFTIIGPTTGSATVLVQEGTTLTIKQDAVLILDKNIKMNNDGQIIGGGEIFVGGSAQFYTSNPVSVKFDGTGKIILEDATETLNLSDKLASPIVAEPTQKVIITGNLTIRENQYLIVNGDLEIPEGVTVTIEKGGLLKLTSPTASATIAGTIKSLGQYDSNDAGFTVDDSVTKDVIITGQVIAGKTNENEMSVKIDGYAYLEGTISVSAKAAAYFDNLNVAEDAAVTIKGIVSGNIYNQGTVTMDGSASDSITIYNKSTTAIVNVESISSGTLTVSDKGLYLKTIDTTRYTVPCTVTELYWTTVENQVSFQNVKGITVTESIEYEYNVNGERNPINHMNISGSVSVSNTKEIPIGTPVMTVVTGTVWTPLT